MLKSNDINEIYKKLCKDLLSANKVNNTREITNVEFELTDIDNNIIGVRNISLPYLFGELLWYFNGSRDMRFISKFGSMWKRLTDDGCTNNSAYGYILKYKHGFDQIAKIIKLLKTDPTSRRAVLNINVPNPYVIETRDEPCTIALQFMIRDGKLHCTGIMRSNDIWFGLPYDVVFFTELQKYIANRLDLKYGTYTHFVTSMHVYDRNIEDITKVLETEADTRWHIDIMRLVKDCANLYEYVDASDQPKVDIMQRFNRLGICYENKDHVTSSSH